MSFAILRTSKVTASKVGGVNAHNTREMEVPNADPKESDFNYQLAGTKSLKNDIENRLEEAGIHKTRKNAVLGIEHMMTASPEYFSNDGDNRKFYEFENECMNWLKDRYGEENIINVHAHFDEHTPHLHAIVTPIVEKDVKWKNGTESGIKRENRLSARDYINGSKAMSEMQDSFAQHMKKSGLELDRGTKGSKATHTEIKHFYNSIQEAQKEIKQEKPSLIDEKVTFQKKDNIDNALQFKWVTEEQHRKNQEDKANQLIEKYQNQAMELSKQLNDTKSLLKEESRLKSNLEVSNEKLAHKNNSLIQENKDLKHGWKNEKIYLEGEIHDFKSKYEKEKRSKENLSLNLQNMRANFYNALNKELTKDQKREIKEDLKTQYDKEKPSITKIREARNKEKEEQKQKEAEQKRREEEAKKQAQEAEKQKNQQKEGEKNKDNQQTVGKDKGQNNQMTVGGL